MSEDITTQHFLKITENRFSFSSATMIPSPIQRYDLSLTIINMLSNMLCIMHAQATYEL